MKHLLICIKIVLLLGGLRAGGAAVINREDILAYDHSDYSGLDSLYAKVYVSFLVSRDGKISNIKAKKIDCENCTQSEIKFFKKEAIEIIAGLPDWVPKKDDKGNSIKEKMIIPIKFDRKMQE